MCADCPNPIRSQIEYEKRLCVYIYPSILNGVCIQLWGGVLYALPIDGLLLVIARGPERWRYFTLPAGHSKFYFRVGMVSPARSVSTVLAIYDADPPVDRYYNRIYSHPQKGQ